MLEMLGHIVERYQVERRCAKRQMIERRADPSAYAPMLRNRYYHAIAAHRQSHALHHGEFQIKRGDFQYLMTAARVEPSRLRRQHRVNQSRVRKLGVFALRMNPVLEPIVRTAS